MFKNFLKNVGTFGAHYLGMALLHNSGNRPGFTLTRLGPNTWGVHSSHTLGINSSCPLKDNNGQPNNKKNGITKGNQRGKNDIITQGTHKGKSWGGAYNFERDFGRVGDVVFLALREGQVLHGGRIWEQVDNVWVCSGKIPDKVRWDGSVGYCKRVAEDPLTAIFKTGEWQVVGNHLTWIAPWHFLALNYWPAGLDTPDGMKDYRDKDRKRWWHFYTGYLHPGCMGQLYMKRRRDGASSDMGMLNFWFACSKDRAKSGLISYKDEQAQAAFADFVKIPMKEAEVMYDWLVPTNTATLGSKEIRFQPKDRGKDGAVAKNSVIYTKPTRGKGFDGDKLAFLGVDEWLKWDDADIIGFHRTHKKCLYLGPKRVGYSFWPSTVEKMGKHVERGKKLWAQSKIKNSYPGWIFDPEPEETTSGLWALFLGSYLGLDGFVDVDGSDIVSYPNDRQWKMMEAAGSRRREGAKDFQARERARLEMEGEEQMLQHLKRQDPWTEREAFDANNVNCHFNALILSKAKNALEEVPVMWRRGNFAWVGPGKVEFMDDEKGRFWVSWLPREPNMIDGMGKPLNNKKGVIGVDPFHTAIVSDERRCSMGAAHGLLYFDRTYENDNRRHRAVHKCDMPGYWPTRSIFLKYHARPTAMPIFYEDMMMAAIFYGMPIALETNVNSMEQYFAAKGMSELLLTRAEIKGGVDCSFEDWQTYGIKMTQDLAVECLEWINDFVNGNNEYLGEYRYNLWEDVRRLPFVETIEDLMGFDNTQRTKYDLTMSLMQVFKAERGMTDIGVREYRGSDASGVLQGFNEQYERQAEEEDMLLEMVIRNAHLVKK